MKNVVLLKAEAVTDGRKWKSIPNNRRRKKREQRNREWRTRAAGGKPEQEIWKTLCVAQCFSGCQRRRNRWTLGTKWSGKNNNVFDYRWPDSPGPGNCDMQ